MGRPSQPIVLNHDERDKLQLSARRAKSSQRLALRARIVLGCADGMEIAKWHGNSALPTRPVCKGRERFRRARLEGLADELRPGARARSPFAKWKQ